MPPLTPSPTPLLRLDDTRVYTRNCRAKNLKGLKTVSAKSVEGTNILDQDLIKEMEAAGGKLIVIGGEADYKNHTYDFRIGYSEDCKSTNLGFVSIQNHSSENANLVETREFYLILIELFEKYLI